MYILILAALVRFAVFYVKLIIMVTLLRTCVAYVCNETYVYLRDTHMFMCVHAQHYAYDL